MRIKLIKFINYNKFFFEGNVKFKEILKNINNKLWRFSNQTL